MSRLNWPDGIDRTPEGERKRSNPFDVGFRTTKSQLGDELEREGVDAWWLDHVTGSTGDSSVVLRWEKGGNEYAAACDRYTDKYANLRDLYLWFRETRKRKQRPTKTVQDAFAAAQLPPTDEEAIVLGSGRGEPAHEVLGVPKDADPEVVKRVARGLQAKYQPDSGSEPDREMFKKVTEAKEAMLNG